MNNEENRMGAAVEIPGGVGFYRYCSPSLFDKDMRFERLPVWLVRALNRGDISYVRGSPRLAVNRDGSLGAIYSGDYIVCDGSGRVKVVKSIVFDFAYKITVGDKAVENGTHE